MMLLLGDQLIRDPGIAVFELVKNAYDADSASVKITMTSIDDPEEGRIVLEDQGSGMDYGTVTSVWLQPGTDYRVEQKKAGFRTDRFHRLPLGEKGVGRFAAHKLGNRIRLITRKLGCPEVVADIDWTTFDVDADLGDVRVRVREREPKHFVGNQRQGTRIEISELREPWSRGMARDLARAVTAISSPFQTQSDFSVELDLTDHGEWLKGLLSVKDVLDQALYRAHCELKGDQLKYRYTFVPYAAMGEKVAARTVSREDVRIVDTDGHRIDLDSYHLGPVSLDLFIFDLEPRILMLGVADRKGLREFLRQSGGVRVYRDGIRVYDYGEPGNDWLNLGALRVNVPALRLSNNLVIGAVHLDAAKSLDLQKGRGLIEKTNREGFVEGPAYRAFKDSVYCAVRQVEAERNIDKTKIRVAFDTRRQREPVMADVQELRKLVEERHLGEELGSYIDRIENDFVVIRDRFITSASAGLSLAVVIHEVDKGVTELVRAVEEEHASPRVKVLAKHLADLVEGFGALVRKPGMSRERASDLVSQALANVRLRLRYHKIDVVTDIATRDFEVVCSRRLIVSTLMNLIDNSIWWLRNKWGDVAGRKRIFLGTTDVFAGGPGIVVADNGPGFSDPPEYLVEPFITRKPDGMGLGLHLADQVMRVHKGRLEFPQEGDVNVPEGFEGAVVAVVFLRSTE
jgi:signal transduction histidine kinase